MTKEELTQMYMEFLQAEGFLPRIDADGDVAFKFEGGNYVIMIADNDAEYFRLAYPGFWAIENEEERLRVHQSALQASIDIKVTKVYPVGNDTWAAVEMFCNPPEHFKTVFMRSLRAIKAGVESFRKHMHASNS